jgi:hypothetical protein
MSSSRRFWPPSVIDETNSSCIIVRDVTEQALGYFYFEEEPGRRTAANAQAAADGRAACQLRAAGS